MKIEIGSTVTFIKGNVQFKGIVTDIQGGFCFVAVLGYPGTFQVTHGQCLPVVTG